MQSASEQKTVAVTGGTGFIGERLVRALLAEGARLVLLARSQTRPQELPWSDERIEWVPVELEDSDGVRGVLEREQPDVLFHLAGTRGRDGTASASLASAEVNVHATVRLLDA